jgi:hypothetical protein
VAVRGISGMAARPHVQIADSVPVVSLVRLCFRRSEDIWRCRQERTVKTAGTASEPATISAAEPVSAPLLPPEPVRAGDRLPSLVTTIGAHPDRPALPAPAELPARPAGNARREPRSGRRLAIAAIAIAVAAVAAIGLSVPLLDRHPAPVPPVTESLETALSSPASLIASSVAFGPSDTLATSDTNGRTYLWNTATKKVTATFAGPASQQGVLEHHLPPMRAARPSPRQQR